MTKTEVSDKLLPRLREKLVESVSAVLPISAIVLILSIFIIPIDVGTMVMFILGSLIMIFGMALFQLGAETALSPLGEGIGIRISKTKSLIPIIISILIMGVLVTMAEPDLSVLASQVPAVPNFVIILAVSIGVGIFLVLAVLRILLGWDLRLILDILYLLLIVAAVFMPENFLPVSFDSGGVTTGPITVPFIMAMGAGLFAMRTDKNARDDSFGLVSLASVGPIIATLIIGFFYNPTSADYESAVVPQVDTMQQAFYKFFGTLPTYNKEVLISIIPLVAVFIIFQVFGRPFKRNTVYRIIIGFIYTYLGLVMFLCGVSVGFSPVGTMLGRQIATSDKSWALIPIVMVIGFFIVRAEPAIQILTKQIQNITDGAISDKSIGIAMSVGVAVAAGLSAIRILTGISLKWIIIPGYVLAIVLTRLVPKLFVGMAFDSGGVASGPITSTFLLPICIGACESLGGNIMTEAFGVVSLVALTPLIAVQLTGLIYSINHKKVIKKFEKTDDSLIEEDSDEIIEFYA